jgi:hypothetical protein
VSLSVQSATGATATWEPLRVAWIPDRKTRAACSLATLGLNRAESETASGSGLPRLEAASLLQ